MPSGLRRMDIMNPRSVHEIIIRKPYNIDLESIFKNADGSSYGSAS